MTNLRAFALGMMVVWTPSLIAFAYFLWRDLPVATSLSRRDLSSNAAAPPQGGQSGRVREVSVPAERLPP